MGKKPEENQKKTFTDLTTKRWFIDNQKIKVGNSFGEINSGKVTVIEIKEFLEGNLSKTWKIVVDKEDKIYLLKKSGELK